MKDLSVGIQALGGREWPWKISMMLRHQSLTVVQWAYLEYLMVKFPASLLARVTNLSSSLGNSEIPTYF